MAAARNSSRGSTSLLQISAKGALPLLHPIVHLPEITTELALPLAGLNSFLTSIRERDWVAPRLYEKRKKIFSTYRQFPSPLVVLRESTTSYIGYRVSDQRIGSQQIQIGRRIKGQQRRKFVERQKVDPTSDLSPPKPPSPVWSTLRPVGGPASAAINSPWTGSQPAKLRSVNAAIGGWVEHLTCRLSAPLHSQIELERFADLTELSEHRATIARHIDRGRG